MTSRALRYAKFFALAAVASLVVPFLLIMFLFNDAAGFLAFAGWTVVFPVSVAGTAVCLALASVGGVRSTRATWVTKLGVIGVWLLFAFILPPVITAFEFAVISPSSPLSDRPFLTGVAMFTVLGLCTLAVAAGALLPRRTSEENSPRSTRRQVVVAGVAMVALLGLLIQNFQVMHYRNAVERVEHWEFRGFDTHRDTLLSRAGTCFTLEDARDLLDSIDALYTDHLAPVTADAVTPPDTDEARAKIDSIDTGFCEREAEEVLAHMDSSSLPTPENLGWGQLTWHSVILEKYPEDGRPSAVAEHSFFEVRPGLIRSMRERASQAKSASERARELYREERQGKHSEANTIAKDALRDVQQDLTAIAIEAAERLIADADAQGTPEADDLAWEAKMLDRAKPGELRETLADFTRLVRTFER